MFTKREANAKCHHCLFSDRPKTVIFPNLCVPDERDLSTGSNYNPQNTKCMDACPAVFKQGGCNFRLPPLKVRDIRLDLGKNS